MKPSEISFNLITAFIAGAFLAIIALPINAMEKVHARFNEERITYNAALYGNKGAHQYELQEIVLILNEKLKTKRFAVPPFYTGQHNELASYLQDIPYQNSTVYTYLHEQWKLFVDTQKRHQGRTLAPDARIFLQNIAQALSYAAQMVPFGVHNDAYTTFLRGIEGKIIVRSSGRSEDSKTVSLAGAYESIGNLAPEPEDITQGIYGVLASYVSEKALSQRVAAQDEHLYDDPFLAVLIQKMVGLTGIPISGVLFTQEAEGRTPGVADIRCVWGLNDGLVNSLVAFDTYYVGPSRTIYPLIGNKTSRIIAGKGRGTIEQVANDSTLHRKPCLTHQLILDLKLCAEVVEDYYGCPQDVEFVIDNDVIYLVQSRPVTYDETIKPSYLPSQLVALAPQKLPIHMISAAGGAVRVITTKQDVVVTERIVAALRQYLDSDTKDALQAVVLGVKAPGTSHEGTVFRAGGKALASTPSYRTVIEWLTAGKLPLLIDTQRGLILPEGDSNSLIAGWFVHPIPQKVSVMNDFVKPVSRDFFVTWKEYHPGIPTSKLCELMKPDVGTSVTTAKEAVCSLMFRLAHRLRQEKLRQDARKASYTDTNHELLPALISAVSLASSAAEELIGALDRWEKSHKTEQDRIACLYPINFLEALLTQAPEIHDHTADFSIGSLLKDELQEKSLVEELSLRGKTMRSFIAHYAKIAPYAITAQAAGKWKLFLKHLAQVNNTELQKKFALLMRNLAHLDMLPLWLNLSFPKSLEASQTEKNIEKLILTLVEDYDKDASFLSELKALKQQLATFKTANFEDPQNFSANWTSLQEQCMTYFMKDEFVKKFRAAGMLGQVAALEAMKQVVTTVDLSIKGLKRGQTHYQEVTALIARFKTMVKVYFAMLFYWFNELHPPITVPENDAAHYFETIERLIDEAPAEPAQLLPFREFSVARYVLGAARGARENILSAGQRPTIENTFSLVHQGLLAEIASLASQCGIADIPCPEYAQGIKSVLDNRNNTFAGPGSSLMGVEFGLDEIKYIYNWPVANHGITFTLTVATRTQSARLSFEISHWAQKGANGGLENATAMLRLAHAPYIDFLHEPSVDGEGTYSHEVTFNEYGQEIQILLPLYLRLMYDISEDASTLHHQSLTDLFLRNASPKLRQQRLAQFVRYAGQASSPSMLNFIAYVLENSLLPKDPSDLAKDILEILHNIFARELIQKQKAAEMRKAGGSSRWDVQVVENLLQELATAARRVLKELVHDGHELAYPLALKEAQRLDVSIDRGCELFKELFAKSRGFEEALSTVRQASLDRGIGTDHAVQLASMLVDAGYEAAYPTALEVSHHSDKLCADLVRCGYEPAYARALSIAAQRIIIEGHEFASWDTSYEPGIHLYKELFKRKIGHKEAFEVAQKACASFASKNSGLALFEALIMHGHLQFLEDREAYKEIYDSALRFATQLVTIYRYPDNALALLSALVYKGHGTEAIETALLKVLSIKGNDNSFCLRLWKRLKTLIGKKQGAKVITATYEALNQNESKSARGYHELFLEIAQSIMENKYEELYPLAHTIASTIVQKVAPTHETCCFWREDTCLKTIRHLLAEGYKPAIDNALQAINLFRTISYGHLDELLEISKLLVSQDSGYNNVCHLIENILSQATLLQSDCIGLLKTIILKKIDDTTPEKLRILGIVLQLFTNQNWLDWAQTLTVLDALQELLKAGIGYDCIAQAACSFDMPLAHSRSNNLWDKEKGFSGYNDERGLELQGKIAQLFSTLIAKDSEPIHEHARTFVQNCAGFEEPYTQALIVTLQKIVH